MSGADDRLIPFALGLLSDEENGELEQELEQSAVLRRQLDQAIDLLYDMTEFEQPMRPSPTVREQILESVSAGAISTRMVERLSHFFDLGRERIGELLASARDPLAAPWESIPVPGVRLLHFDGGPAVADADCGLIFIAAGATFPKHPHKGDEWSLVLQGSIEEIGGRRYEVGDVGFAPAGSSHALRVVGDSDVLLAVIGH